MSNENEFQINERQMDSIMKDAIEFAGIGLYRYKFDGTVLFMNRCAMRIFDIEDKFPDPSAVAGKNISDLITYTGPKGFLRKEVRKHRRIHSLEDNFRTLSGINKWVEHDLYLVRDSETGKEAIQAIMYDITERKHAEERIEHLNLVLRTIRNLNQLITREKDRDRLIKRTCETLLETRGYYTAWVVILDESGRFVTAAEAGLGKNFISMIIKLKRGKLTDCNRRVLKQSEVVVTEDPVSACRDCPLANKYHGRGAMSVRLEYKEKVYGILSVSIPADLTLDNEERYLFKEVAGDIAFAFYNIELEEKHKHSEEKLRKSEERFRDISENALEWVWECDVNGKYTYTNKIVKKILGYKPEEILKKHFYDLFHPEDRKELKKAAFEVFAKKQPFHEFINRARHKNGKTVWLSTCGVPILDKKGNLIGYRGADTDITQRREAEEALAKERNLLRTLIDNLPDDIYIKDTDSRFVLVNNATVFSLGATTSDEVIGNTDFDFKPHELAELHHADEQRIIKSGQPMINRVEPAIDPAGNRVWYSTTKVPLRNNSGKIIGLVGIGKDITERKQSDKALRESEEKYRTLFEESKDVIFICTPDGKFLDINPAGVKLFGYSSEEEILKINIDKELYFDSSIRKAVKRNLDQQGFVKNYEILLKRKDGQHITVVMTANTVMDENGKVAAYRGIMRDITERKKMEQQLIQAQKMESIGTLAGGIAHDFNNILCSILGFASLMKIKISKDHQFFNYIDTIEKSAQRAAELTNQLLAFSRGGKYVLEPINLNSIVNDILKIITQTFDRSIEIETYLYDQLPTIEVDSGQIHQAVMNLCLNARDAMLDGGKLIIETDEVMLTEEYIKTHMGARQGRYVILSVIDTGIGIAKETQHRIFEPFFTTKETGEGTGLGLAMVYGVVKNHGGYVSVYSEKDEGTTFKVYLPVSGKPKAKRLEEDIEMRGGDELILIVDDEESIRFLAKDILEGHGYTVLLAENGAEAINVYTKKRDEIDLVILDIVMPKMGGKKTFLRLKKINPEVKVLLSTGYSQNGKAKEILDSGVKGFIQKPYQVNKLLSKVRSVLDKKM